MTAEWLLFVWLCASPGPGGSCRPVDVRPQPSRSACMAARAAERAANDRIHASCRLDGAEFDDAPPDWDEIGGAG